jgi:hypothetical protein
LVAAGGPAFTLTVTGAGFTGTSQVLWDGAALPTTFADTSQLWAAVDAGRLGSPGSAAISVSDSGLPPATLLIAAQLFWSWLPLGQR